MTHASRAIRARRGAARLMVGGLACAGLALTAGPAIAHPPKAPAVAIPDFGPNVTIFDPSTPVAQINARLQSLATASTGFDLNRNAVFFLPGTYGSAAGQDDPATAGGIVDAPVGFMESVHGLGASPDDVTINGNLRAGAAGGFQLSTFWRSLSNLRINPIQADEAVHTLRWNTSQASPLRRVDVTGNLDVAGGLAFGNAIASTRVAGTLNAGLGWVTDTPPEQGQAQYFVRDSEIGSFRGHAADFVFSGVDGAPPTAFNPGDTTTLPTTSTSRDAPFLYLDHKRLEVFVPRARTSTSGIRWGTDRHDGTSVPLDRFLIARPSDTAAKLNQALAHGKNLIMTPGVYSLDQPLHITRPDTVVMGLGYATLTPTAGNAVIEVGDVAGVVISALTVDNGAQPSDVLLQIGSPDTNDRGRHHFDRWWHRRRDHRGRTDDPTTLHDVFVRIGGTVAGTASTSLEVNQDDVLLDHVWLWRADHGVPGTTDWTVNPAETGLVVNGDDVTALGLFVEHYEKTQVLWNGEGGRTVFFECEPPYDPPTQALWMNGTENGYPCYQVADDVRTHDATGIATWTFFRAPPPNVISMHSAIKAPVTPGVQFHNTTAGKILGSGGTEHVFNDSGPGVDSSGPASFIPGLTAIRQVTTGP